MQVSFDNEKLATICNSDPDESDKIAKYIKRKKAPHLPIDIIKVLEQLRAAPTAQDLSPMLNFHLLSENRSGTAAVDVRVSAKVKGVNGRGKWRMILKPISNCNDINRKDSIDQVIITEILEDYHKK